MNMLDPHTPKTTEPSSKLIMERLCTTLTLLLRVLRMSSVGTESKHDISVKVLAAAMTGILPSLLPVDCPQNEAVRTY